jgi:putative sterol carrier protein
MEAMLAETLKLQTQRLSPRLRPALIERPETHFQFYFRDGEPFHLSVAGDQCRFEPGIVADPDINLFIDTHETCWALLDCRMEGMTAFLEGRYRADGNIVLSQLLLYLFDAASDRATAHEVRD